MHNAQRTGQPFHRAARLIAAIGAGTCIATGSAWAALGSCDGSSDACSFDMGRVIVTLDQGAASYSAGAEFLSGELPLHVGDTNLDKDILLGDRREQALAAV